MYEYSPLAIFAFVFLAMVATSIWESSVEGRNAWDKGKFGWKITLGKYSLTRYHFFLFVVMWPVLLGLPLAISGWDKELFGILLSAYFLGLVVEDFVWFIVNPEVSLKEFNPGFADHYPWVDLKVVRVPLGYVVGILVSILSYLVLWR